MPISATDRRTFLTACSKLGLAGTLFPGVLWGMAEGEPQKITVDMISQAAVIADVPIPDEDREMMLRTLQDAAKGYDDIYNLHMANGVQPAMVFDPLITPDVKFEKEKRPMQMSPALPGRGVPTNVESVAFNSVRELAELVRTRKVSSTALTEMYLERLRVITRCCFSSSPSLKTAGWRKPRKPTAPSLRENIAGRCTGFRGARRICSR
ncbi:MAG: hypothetical protein WAN10_09405 [Candidatus Acidiferrales bacterium]